MQDTDILKHIIFRLLMQLLMHFVLYDNPNQIQTCEVPLSGAIHPCQELQLNYPPMSLRLYELWCYIAGGYNYFSTEIDPSKSLGHLKRAFPGVSFRRSVLSLIPNVLQRDGFTLRLAVALASFRRLALPLTSPRISPSLRMSSSSSGSSNLVARLLRLAYNMDRIQLCIEHRWNGCDH